MSEERPYVLHRVACSALKATGACDCDGLRLLDELLAAAHDCSAEGQAAARERHKVATAVRKNPVLEEMVQNKRLQAFDRLTKSAAIVSGALKAGESFLGFSPSLSGLHVRIKTSQPGKE
jgi:tellurite resistance protein